MFNPNWVKTIEADLEKQGDALLKGGSSLSNIYRGGAAAEKVTSVRPASAGGLLQVNLISGPAQYSVLQFPAIIRLLSLLILEWFIALWEVARGVYHGESIFMELKFVISRVFVCIGLRELITIGAGVDLARGLPIVH